MYSEGDRFMSNTRDDTSKCADCGKKFGVGVDKFALANDEKMTRSAYRCHDCIRPIKDKIKLIRNSMWDWKAS